MVLVANRAFSAEEAMTLSIQLPELIFVTIGCKCLGWERYQKQNNSDLIHSTWYSVEFHTQRILVISRCMYFANAISNCLLYGTLQAIITLFSLCWSLFCLIQGIHIHYNDVIMSAMASQIISPTIVYQTVYSRRGSNKTLNICVTSLCAENSPVTGEFPTQRASKAENVTILVTSSCICIY